MIQSALSGLGRKITSLTLVAFERLTETDRTPARNGTKLSAWLQVPNELTTKAVDNVEEFEGIGTLLHQCRCEQRIFLATPIQSELPEADTTW